MSWLRWVFAALLLASPALGQTPGTLNLSGPSTGGQVVTPATINAAVNSQFGLKADATNPVISGTIIGANASFSGAASAASLTTTGAITSGASITSTNNVFVNGGVLNLGTAGGGGGTVQTAATGGGNFNFALSGTGSFIWKDKTPKTLMSLATANLIVNVPVQSTSTYTAPGPGPGANYILSGSGPIALIQAGSNYTGSYSGIDGIVTISNASDDVNITNASGFAGTNFRSIRNFGGPNTNGGRSAAIFSLVQSTAVPRTTVGQYISVGMFSDALANAGGTGLIGGQAAGALYSFYPQAILHAGATNFGIVSIAEGDIGIVPSSRTVDITGVIASGDTFTLTITSADVAGSPLALVVTAGTGDTAVSIVNKLMAAMHTSVLRSVGIGGMQTSTQQLTVTWPVQGATLTVAASTSGAAVLTLGSVVSGGSSQRRAGLNINRSQVDGAAGSNQDTGLEFGGLPTASHASGWRTGINFIGTSMSPTGTMIGAQPQFIFAENGSQAPFMPMQVKYGIDWSLVNFTLAGGIAIKLSGVGIGAGAVNLQNATITTTSVGLVLDVPGGRIGTGNPAIVSGGGGGSGQDANKYFVGDIIYGVNGTDANGGQYLVTTVNDSTGAVTGLTTLVQPSTTTASLGVAIATTGGSGTGLTITPTAATNNAISIAPTGGPATVGGSLAVTGILSGPTAAVDTNTTQAATTAFVLAQASAALPLIDGTATIGTSTRFARADHIHPTDTTRAALTGATFTGGVNIGNNTTAQAFRLNGAAGAGRAVGFSTAGVLRWQFNANATAEGGSNAGTDMSIQAFDDTGALLSTPLTITRSSGLFNFAGAMKFTGSQIVANGVVATTVTSLGPTGSHTTIQEWLTIQNASGVTRYIPLY